MQTVAEIRVGVGVEVEVGVGVGIRVRAPYTHTDINIALHLTCSPWRVALTLPNKAHKICKCK